MQYPETGERKPFPQTQPVHLMLKVFPKSSDLRHWDKLAGPHGTLCPFPTYLHVVLLIIMLSEWTVWVRVWTMSCLALLDSPPLGHTPFVFFVHTTGKKKTLYSFLLLLWSVSLQRFSELYIFDTVTSHAPFQLISLSLSPMLSPIFSFS